MDRTLTQLEGRENTRLYREQIEAEVAEAGYDDDWHRNTQAGFRSQKRLETNINFNLRDFTDASDWENPGGIPAGADAQSVYLPNMARSQAKAIVAIQDRLSKSKLGRAMVDTAHRGHVEFSFGKLPEPGTLAGYLDRQRQVVYNLQGDLVNASDSQDFINNAVIDTAHELGHMGQAQAVGSSFSIRDYTLGHQERLLALRHYEASASAASVQVAWELGEAGDLGPWEAITAEGSPDADAARAYGELASRDPGAVTDGRARRAAHDAWFQDAGRQAAYEDSLTLGYHQVLTAIAMQQAVGYPHANAKALATQIGTAPANDDHLLAAGAMPDGVNHLALPGGKPLRDPSYAEIKNPRVAEQVAFLDQIAAKFRAGDQVTPQMLSGYDAIADKYDGTPHAQDPDITAFGDDIPGEPDSPLDQMNPVGASLSALGKWRQDRGSDVEQGPQVSTTPSLRRVPGVS